MAGLRYATVVRNAGSRARAVSNSTKQEDVATGDPITGTSALPTPSESTGSRSNSPFYICFSLYI